MSGAPTPRPEARGRLERTRSGGYTTTPWPTAVAPRWRRCSQVISYVLRHTLSGKRHASCGGYARAYGLEADWRPGLERRPSERVRRRRKPKTRRDYSPHKMTAQGRRVTTRLLVQQPGPCRALPPHSPPAQAPLHGRTTGRRPAQLIDEKRERRGHASQERGIKGGFGAAKMRFDEGEERAARAAPVCSRPTPPRLVGPRGKRGRTAARSRKRAVNDLTFCSISFLYCRCCQRPHFATKFLNFFNGRRH